MKIYYCDETQENIVTLDELDGDLIKNKKVYTLVRDFTNMGFRKISLIKLDIAKFERVKNSFRL